MTAYRPALSPAEEEALDPEATTARCPGCGGAMYRRVLTGVEEGGSYQQRRTVHTATGPWLHSTTNAEPCPAADLPATRWAATIGNGRVWTEFDTQTEAEAWVADHDRGIGYTIIPAGLHKGHRAERGGVEP